jgi:hypothetical protein
MMIRGNGHRFAASCKMYVKTGNIVNRSKTSIIGVLKEDILI